jgi:UDP:flavonoid glycosyltransferase YjiC (YdhE family)
MHITLLALGSTGDILPYTALGKGLKDAGYQVRFVTFEGFASTVKKLELDFHPIPGDPRSLVARGGTNIFTMAQSFGSVAYEYTQALSAPHLRETDLIINQLPGGIFGYDLAEKIGVPMVMAAVIPLARTKTFPMMGFPQINLPGYNQITYTLSEIAAWGIMGRAINQWRTQELRLPSLSRKAYFGQDGTGSSLVLKGFSSRVVERPLDWGRQIHITGYWFPEEPEWAPPPDLVKFIEKDQPPIFIGFGSMPVKDPVKTTQVILQAIKKTNQRAIIHEGWSGLGNIDLPDAVYKIDYAPYGWLFPKMGMVIHHGGSGTTAFALRAGVPSCAVPLIGFDQIYWGRRITALGVGPPPIPLRKLNVNNLSEIILQGVEDQYMHNNAVALGDMIRKETGIENAVRVIDQFTV